MRVQRQQWGYLELHNRYAGPLWVRPDAITSVRSASRAALGDATSDGESIITVALVELQVQHTPAELMEAIGLVGCREITADGHLKYPDGEES